MADQRISVSDVDDQIVTGDLRETIADAETAPKPDRMTTIPDPTRYGDWEKNGRCIDF